jgi:hypothetical protein
MLSIHPGYGSFQALITDIQKKYNLFDYEVSLYAVIHKMFISLQFILAVLINPYPANVENMVSS